MIVLSARAGEEAKVEGLRRGADDYLVKPFSARELLARVAANIELSRTRAQSARLLHEEAQILELLEQSRHGGRRRARSRTRRSGGYRCRDRAVGRRLRLLFLQRHRREGRGLYALYAVGRAARGVRQISDAAQHRGFRADFPRRGRSSAPTTSPRIRAMARTRPISACRRGIFRCAAIWPRRSSRASGEVLGGLFFGHPEVGVFSERAERIVAAIAVQAGIAIDKARLYRAAQDEIERRERVEAELRESETRYRGALITGRIAAWETDMVTSNQDLDRGGHATFRSGSAQWSRASRRQRG